MNKSFGERFVMGWQSIFGKGEATGEKKPFPKDHFFSSEEVDFLSSSTEELNILEKWAIQLSKWARDKAQWDKKLPGVKWKDGILTTWIDGVPQADTKTRQAERLQILKVEGYHIPSHYETIIEDKVGTDLVGKFFKNTSSKTNPVIMVDVYHRDMQKGPTVSISSYDNPASNPKLHELTLAEFQAMLSSQKLKRLSLKESTDWKQKRENIGIVGSELKQLIKDIVRSYPPTLGGSFSEDLQEVLYSKHFGKNVIPQMWTLSGDSEMAVGVYMAEKCDKVHHVNINTSNAYLHQELINAVKNLVNRDNLDAQLDKLTTLMGNKIGDTTIVALMESHQIATSHGMIDGLVLSSNRKLSAFKNPNHEEVPLTLDDYPSIREGLIEEGLRESKLLIRESKAHSERLQMLTKELSLILGGQDELNKRMSKFEFQQKRIQEEQKRQLIPVHDNTKEEIKDIKPYFDSLKDKSNALSGDVELLLSGSEVSNLYSRYESLEEEYYGSVCFLCPENRKDLEDKINQSYTNYKNKVMSLVEAYQEHYQDAASPAPRQEAIQLDELSEAFATPEKGRWHTDDFKQKEAYIRYGKLIAEKLNLQLTYPEIPWLQAPKAIPHNSHGDAYQGKDALVLALLAEKEGYELPLYVTQEEIQKANLRVDMRKEPFPLITGQGILQLYNIEQTDLPQRDPARWEWLKTRFGHQDQASVSSLLRLKEVGSYPANIHFDGKKDIASYSSKEDCIHLSPQHCYDKQDDFYRDLSIGLMRSTRIRESQLTSYENLVKEDLLAHIGGAMIGQKYQFEVRSLNHNKFWKELLQDNPSFTKNALAAAERSTGIIFQYAEKASTSENYGKSIDLRSTTPIEQDVDGNGIVESQENLAADNKQGANEELSNELPSPHHALKTKHTR